MSWFDIFLGIDPGSTTGIALMAPTKQLLAVGAVHMRETVPPHVFAERVLERIGSLVDEARAALLHQHDLLVTEGAIRLNVAIESQYYSKYGKTPPQDVVVLAKIAAAIQGALWFSLRSAKIPIGRFETPIANTWKGNVDKPAHHRRMLKHLRWTPQTESSQMYDGVVNGRGQWVDIRDAIGLALWLLTERRA